MLSRVQKVRNRLSAAVSRLAAKEYDENLRALWKEYAAESAGTQCRCSLCESISAQEAIDRVRCGSKSKKNKRLLEVIEHDVVLCP